MVSWPPVLETRDPVLIAHHPPMLPSPGIDGALNITQYPSHNPCSQEIFIDHESGLIVATKLRTHFVYLCYTRVNFPVFTFNFVILFQSIIIFSPRPGCFHHLPPALTLPGLPPGAPGEPSYL